MLVLKKHKKKPRSSGRHTSPIHSGVMVNIMPMAIPNEPDQKSGEGSRPTQTRTVDTPACQMSLPIPG